MKNYKELIDSLTLEEKALLLTGSFDKTMHTHDIPEKDIRGISMSDGPSGVRVTWDDGVPGGDVAFAPAISMASTWDRELIKEVGVGLGKSCKAHNVDMLLAPAVNLHRNPLCGRNYEYFSEDPYLAGELAAEYVNGIQSEGVGTSLKHYAMNHQERFRSEVNVNVDERTMRELYLRVFEIVVKKSQPTSIMCAYNKVNGPYCSENKKLLTKILREEWGFEGELISDWGAIHNPGKAFAAGMDLQMPVNRNIIDDVKLGLQRGWCTMEDIDRAVEKNIRLVDRILDMPRSDEEYNRDEVHEIAQRAAADGIVMLKNEKNILPLTKEKKIKTIAVLGKFAEDPMYAAGNWTSGGVTVDFESVDKPLDYIKKYAAEIGAEVVYEPLYEKECGEFGMPLRDKMIKTMAKGDVVIFFAGYHPYHGVEGDDRLDLYLPYSMTRLASEVARMHPKSIIVQQNGCAIAPYDYLGDPKVILQTWMTGEGGGKAVADVLFGKVNPNGKLPCTFMREMDPEVEFPGDGRKLDYKERMFIGYRYYDKHPEKVWYPFGHGLSYTTFEYSNLVITPEKSDDPKQIVKVKFDITNTGDVKGKEIAQVYVSAKDGTIVRPIKELQGFDKVELEPGETKTVTIELDERAFAYWNTNEDDWHVESGEYDIMVAASATDIRLSGVYTIEWDKDYTIARERWDDAWAHKVIMAGNEE